MANRIGFPSRHRRGTDAVQVTRTARFCVSHRLVSYVRHDRNADSRVTTRCLTPSGTCWVDRYGPAFPSTTAAFRCNPANFARFIGDFRNAALNASWSSARISRASVTASFPSMNSRGANGDPFARSAENFTFHGQTLWEMCRYIRFEVELATGLRTLNPASA